MAVWFGGGIAGGGTAACCILFGHATSSDVIRQQLEFFCLKLYNLKKNSEKKVFC
jgi:hypothetical protein